MMFVTLQQASDHLRYDATDDDLDLTLKIQAASAAVLSYLKSRRFLYTAEVDSNGDDLMDDAGYPVAEVDSSGGKTVRYQVQIATLLLIGYFYKDRDGNPGEAYQQGYLPAPVTALLYNLRDPALK